MKSVRLRRLENRITGTRASNRRRWGRIAGQYGIAAGAVFLALVFRMMLDPLLGEKHPFPTFFLAVILVAWWRGWAPGLLAVALGALASQWFFIPPRGGLWPRDTVCWVGLGSYVGVGVAICGFAWRMRHYQGKLKRQVEGVARSHEALACEIEDRKEAEAALRRSEEEFRTAFELCAVAQAQADPVTGQLLRANSKCCEMTGYSKEETLAMTFIRLLPEPEQRRCWIQFERLVRGDVPVLEAQERLLRKDGRQITVNLAAALVRDTDGRPLRVTAVAQDVTKQKEIEEAFHSSQERLRYYAAELEARVQERTADLEQSIRAMQDFTYTIAHDLRAPMRAVHSFATLLLEHYGDVLNEEGRDFAQRITGAALRMDELIRDLLEYGRVASEQVALGEVMTEKVVEAAVQLVQSSEQGARSRIEVAHPLPRVRANAAVLRKTLVRLLENAVTYTKPGVTPEVRICAEEHDGWVRLQIRDNGPGIAREFHEQIFRAFQRLPPYTGEGTGMGLAIVQKAVERMRGRVGVESAPGQGSCFWIDFPQG